MGVRKIAPDQRSVGDPTPGIVREEAIAVDGMWSGLARTAPGVVSGWHHHGTHETTIYIVRGAMKIESGPGGAEVVDLEPGDFCHIPAGIVHRESNPSTEETQAVVVRAGIGAPTVNVEGPGGSADGQ